jgi:hypothetical protein
MNRWRIRAITSRLAVVVLCAATCHATVAAQQSPQSAGAGSVARYIGAIKAINGSQITLTPDSGPEVTALLQSTTRIVRIAPGEKDLKNAIPIQAQDLQVGDRLLVGGKTSSEGLFAASSVVVMKRSDVESRHQQELQDWQKRGVDGLVSSVDTAAGTVTISARGKNIVVHTSHGTTIRRYAPDSIKFDDASPGALMEVHPGDQVRARGDRSPDGSELTAEEIVSGSFRNIAGTVSSVDPGSSSLSVHDVLSNKSVAVKVTQDSQLRSLPPEVAQWIATRLKGAAAAAVPDGAANGANPHASGGARAREAGASGRSGPPDFQQMLIRLPAITLADLHKGDALIILSTPGSAGRGTAVTLLSGAEPILQAAPGAGGASILTPWSLSAPSGDVAGP